MERHVDVREKLDALLNALASNDRALVQASNEKLAKSLRSLASVIARADWPSWLQNLMNHVDAYRSHHDNGMATWKAHLLALIRHFDEVNSYRWFEGDDNATAADFDVDQIIENARAAQKINDLFSSLITILEGLAECEELDSVKACEDLNKIISILRRAKAGSFTSQIFTWQFVRRFMPNLITCYLKRSDLVGPAIEAYEKTAEELDIAFANARNDVGQHLLDSANEGFRSKAIEKITSQEILSLPDLRPRPGSKKKV